MLYDNREILVKKYEYDIKMFAGRTTVAILIN